MMLLYLTVKKVGVNDEREEGEKGKEKSVSGSTAMSTVELLVLMFDARREELRMQAPVLLNERIIAPNIESERRHSSSTERDRVENGRGRKVRMEEEK